MNFYKKSDIPPDLLEFFQPVELGMEETPQEYVEKMVQIFREVHRVLKPKGTCWLNIGDSYSSGKVGRTDHHRRGAHGHFVDGKPNEKLACGPSQQNKAPAGIPKKNLLMIPARVAIALQEDGWLLRSEIVWRKPSCIPESVKDRPTRSHEMVYLLTKQERYFYDWEFARDPAKDSSLIRLSQDLENQKGSSKGAEKTNGNMKAVGDLTANWRDVWDISHTDRSPHIAVMPRELARRCIRAGCPEGGTVLDPFAGSGTTGAAALENRRGCVLIELDPNNKKLIDRRLSVNIPLFV